MEKGIEKGRKKEREKAEQEKISMVRGMLESGLSINEVAEISGFSVERVEEIYQEIEH